MWKPFPSLKQLSRLAVILQLFVLMSPWQPCVAKPKGEVCLFNGQRYHVMETFHPKVLPVEDKCVNCTCMQGGEVRCTSADCKKPDCEDPRYIAGECCPVCEEIPNIPPTVEVEVVRPEFTPPPGCDYDGAHYEEGEEFPSNSTNYKPLHDQCVLCQCFRGQVFCHLKKCIITPNCLRTITVSNDCCQQCAEYKVDPEPSKVGRLKPGDCMSSTMGPQRNGTTWKPVVGQFGAMDCVVCKCQNGQVACNRVQCPAKSSYKCKRPQLRRGKCCKECPKKKRTERKVNEKDGRKKVEKKKDGKTDGKKKKCKKEKGGQKKKRKGRKKKRRCKKNNKKVPEKPSTLEILKPESSKTLGTISMDVAKVKLCVHKKADYLVYIIKGDNSHTLILDDLKSGGKWEKIDWTIRKGFITSSKKSSMPENSSLRRKITTKNLIGTSVKRNVKKFFKKLDKKLEKCKKKCRRKILERSVKRLKVRKVNMKKSC